MQCTMWAEGVREVVSAADSDVKFIVTDHPVTTYNAQINPTSPDCAYPLDPMVASLGTQTVFALDANTCQTATVRAPVPTARGLWTRKLLHADVDTVARRPRALKYILPSPDAVGRVGVVHNAIGNCRGRGRDRGLVPPVEGVNHSPLPIRRHGPPLVRGHTVLVDGPQCSRVHGHSGHRSCCSWPTRRGRRRIIDCGGRRCFGYERHRQAQLIPTRRVDVGLVVVREHRQAIPWLGERRNQTPCARPHLVDGGLVADATTGALAASCKDAALARAIEDGKAETKHGKGQRLLPHPHL
jgi:hypothetical protein